MMPKSRFHLIRVRGLKSPAANILKQELLSLGGECATGQQVILGDPEPGDALIMGTRKQLDQLVPKLKSQPFGLKSLARELADFLSSDNGKHSHIPGPLADLGGTPENLPLIMGVLNVTDDSFSDGGEYLDPDMAVEHALKMVADGADIIDVGGESTRPGSDSVPADREMARILPVIERLSANCELPISVDTKKAPVARTALEAGAQLVNDVSGGRHDPEILELVATIGCPYILMHMQGVPKTMQSNPQYELLMDDLHHFFSERLDVALKTGVSADRIILDPGIGFGKSRRDNYEILRRLRELKVFGRPLLVGASRKSFLQNSAGDNPRERIDESVAAGTIAMANGASILRVHDVRPALKARVVHQGMRASL